MNILSDSWLSSASAAQIEVFLYTCLTSEKNYGVYLTGNDTWEDVFKFGQKKKSSELDII